MIHFILTLTPIVNFILFRNNTIWTELNPWRNWRIIKRKKNSINFAFGLCLLESRGSSFHPCWYTTWITRHWFIHIDQILCKYSYWMIMCALMIQIDNSVFMAGKLSQVNIFVYLILCSYILAARKPTNWLSIHVLTKYMFWLLKLKSTFTK